MSIILAFALAMSGKQHAEHMVWVDTACARHTLSECAVTDTRFYNYGDVANVSVQCNLIESVPQVPGWTMPEHPDGRPLNRVSRLDVNGAIVFEQCDVNFYENLSWGGWQGWECLVDPTCSP